MSSYDNLYIDILKIGKNHVKSGISYDNLKLILIESKYDFSCDCIELAVKRWFFDSFHHIVEDHENVKFSDFENHTDCNFIMTGDACLKLVSYETSQTNNKLMWYSVGFGFIAIVVSIILYLASTPK